MRSGSRDARQRRGPMTENSEPTTGADSSSASPSPAAPKPGAPKPGGPRPGAPRPGAPRPGPAASHAVTAAPASDPSKFGRVEEDGTAWVKTADGERQIGSWQAGDATEGLAHFGRRYDDLATEVSLLEARLTSGAGDAKKTKAAAIALSESLSTAAVIGDLDALARRLDVIVAGSDEAAAHAKEEKEQSRAASTARKEALAVEAEQIGSESTQWKTAGDRLREILDEWKTIRGIDRKVDDALWKRYSKARESFNRRRGAAGRAPREADDNLWKRFKGAQDVFFAARNAAASERDAEFEQNAVAKEELLAANANIDPAHGLENARAALRDLQEKWDAIGKVPRDRMQELEAKLRAIETKVRDAVDAEWRRTDPEALARVAQFKERVSQFEEQAAKAQAAGKTKDAEKALAQAKQWREWAEAAESAVNE
eukprot:gene25025-30036_t